MRREPDDGEHDDEPASRARGGHHRQRTGGQVRLRVQRDHRCLHRCLRDRIGHRLGGQPAGGGHLPRRGLPGTGRLLPGLRLRDLQRLAHHLDRRRRVPPGPDDHLPTLRRHRRHHRVRRPAGPRGPRLRRRLQPGRRPQPDRATGLRSARAFVGNGLLERSRPTRSGRTRRSPTTTSWPPTGSGPSIRGPRPRRWPTPGPSISTSRTCSASGTSSWPASPTVHVPDTALDDAYRSGFITPRSPAAAIELHTGVNGYESEYSHDVIGILSNLFTEGEFSDAHALLLEARTVVGSQGQYNDGLWTYPWLWATYLMKSGDLAFVKQNFTRRWRQGPGPAQHRGCRPRHRRRPDRAVGHHGGDRRHRLRRGTGRPTTTRRSSVSPPTGISPPGSVISPRPDGPPSSTTVCWRQRARRSTRRSSRYGLDYLPCSMMQPNTANTCANPAGCQLGVSPFGRWAWDGSLLGATLSGPGIALLDATYAYGFQQSGGRASARTPSAVSRPTTTRAPTTPATGWPDWPATTTATKGILSYEFMIAHSQSGPNSWWESSTAPSRLTPWRGSHPCGRAGILAPCVGDGPG